MINIHNQIKDILNETNTNNNDKHQFNSFLENEDIHLSLSKQFFLKYHQIDNFVSKFKIPFNKSQKQHVLISSKIKYFTNEYSTRHFLSLLVIKSNFICVKF